MYILLLLFLFSKHAVCRNYISEGGFNLPDIKFRTSLYEKVIGWSGKHFSLLSNTLVIRKGQYISLQSQNGYIEQIVRLPIAGQCNLSFYQAAPSNKLGVYSMEVQWNGEVIATQIPKNKTTTVQSFLVCGKRGGNLLRFQSKGNLGTANGMYIDGVRLNCDGVTQCPNLQPLFMKTIDSLSVTLSLPLSSFSGMRFICLFLQDLWLYHYGKNQYEGTINLVFNVTATIQPLKFMALEKILHWEKFNKIFPISDYLPYTRKRFVQIESSSSVLIKVLFKYFVYTIPQNILLCTIFYLLFVLLKKYEISKHIRRFYFLKSTLLQTLIEGNVAYFTYVCLGHFSTSFTFNFYDKISLLICVLFFWIVVAFSLVYYPLVGQFLRKKACYFIYSYYRCGFSYFFLTVRNLGRSLLIGAIFYYLYEYDECKLLLLSIVQALTIITGLFAMSNGNIFISKLAYCFNQFHHLLLIFLNVSLYFTTISQNDPTLKQTVLDIQQHVIYLIGLNLLATFLIDIFPSQLFQSQKQQNTNQNQHTKKRGVIFIERQVKEVKEIEGQFPQKRVFFNGRSQKKKKKCIKYTKSSNRHKFLIVLRV